MTDQTKLRTTYPLPNAGFHPEVSGGVSTEGLEAAHRVFEVEHGGLFRERRRFAAESELSLCAELSRRHPEWWPISVVEVKP